VEWSGVEIIETYDRVAAPITIKSRRDRRVLGWMTLIRSFKLGRDQFSSQSLSLTRSTIDVEVKLEYPASLM
jgi:hypothetical protein